MQTKHKLIAKCYDKRGKLISTATNQYDKSHPLQSELADRVGLPEKIFLHAEISAIIKARKKTIHKISIARFGADGSTRLAKPCPICQLAIKQAGIKVVEYTL